MTSLNLTERQQRERDYYNQYAKLHTPSVENIDLSPVTKVIEKIERRPWNSYWAIYQFAINHYSEGKRLLDFGTGPGENALRFAKIGYDIEGFDISEQNIEIAKDLFHKTGLKGEFQVSFAEYLPYEDDSFDLIVGIDILHHVDISHSIRECYRVLKYGGKAFFREPVEVPFLDRIRESSIVKKFFPKNASFDNHITEDERKLNWKDERTIRSVFPKVKKHYYFLFARFDKFFREGADPKPSFLEKLDYTIMKMFPFAKRLGGTVIYELEK